ncbi:nucleotide-binding protein [Candidatus Thorarchaeota archaeon]|nr:MAG: nucleotide-binding protein [Candidatus Thorarchaeota archaeon]
MPKEVIIDTNFLTVPSQFNVDIFSEAERLLEGRLEYVVLTGSLEEIEKKLAQATKVKEKRKFRMAKDLAARCQIVEPDARIARQSVDDQILEYAASVSGVIATNDRELRQRAIRKNIPVIFLRGKKRLSLEGLVL